MIAFFLLHHVPLVLCFCSQIIVRVFNIREPYYAADGNIQIWKDYLLKGKQKLVIAFSSIHGHKPGVRSLSAVVDWQQQCDYPVCGCSLIIFGNVGYLPLPQCPKILTNCFLIL